MGSGRETGNQGSRQRTRLIVGVIGLAGIASAQRASLVDYEAEIEAKPRARNFAPAFSGDGARYAYLSQQLGAPAKLIVHHDREKQERELTLNLPPMQRLRWSPDGTQLLIGGGGLFLIRLDDPEAIQTIAAGDSDGDWSADGKTIYYIHRGTEVRAHPLRDNGETETVIASGRGDDLRGLIVMRGGGPIAWIEGAETVVIRYVATNKTIRRTAPGVRQIEWSGDDLLALVGSNIRALAWNGQDKDWDIPILQGASVTSFTVYRREVKVNEPQEFDDNYFRTGLWTRIILAKSRIQRLLP